MTELPADPIRTEDEVDARLRDIFAVLPDREAAVATGELMQRYLGSLRGIAQLPWVDFDARGAVIRAGVTAMDDLSVLTVGDVADHPDLAMLAKLAERSIPVGQVLPSTDGDRFYWYAPAPATVAAIGEPARLRGLVIRLDVFAALVDRFDADRNVTAAEKRMLFQLVAGAGPREAAQADGVSFETKRAQLKSLCAKLDCGGQTDLVRRSIGQLVYLLHLPRPDADDALVAETFARRHLPPSVRLSIHLLDNRRALRVFEVGPSSGRPVLVAHGMLFPLLLLNAGDECDRRGIRLIMPLRSGYLDDQSAAALLRGTDQARDQADIARFMERFGGAIPVVAHSVGASWALEFARRHPGRIDSLTLLSPSFLGNHRPESVFVAFLGGLRALAQRPGILRYIAWQFRKQFLDAQVVRQTWRRICGESVDDLAVLDGTTGAGSIYTWFEAAYRSSVAGAADDLATATADWREALARAPLPVTIVAGVDDPLADYASDRAALAAIPGLRFNPLPAGGHLVAASHPGAVWDALVAAIDDPATR